jgi:hypothetical protein
LTIPPAKAISSSDRAQNERAVLGELGERAWIYRVEADGNHDGKIVARLNNPMRKIAEAQMTPVVWRVPNCVFDDEG